MLALSALIWLPLAISLIVALAPEQLVGRLMAVGSLVVVGVAISVVAGFDLGRPGLQDVTDKVWIGALGIHYKLGVDGLNIALVLLTTVLFSASMIWAHCHRWERPRSFYFHFGLAESAVLGAFCAQDLALFVAFFDLMLIPFYFLAGIWGGPTLPSGATAAEVEAAREARVRATLKLVIYTLVGSFFMLVAAVATGVLASSQHGTPITFVISALQQLPLSHTSQEWIFLCFALAFVVKMPLVPFHGWLTDGYKALPIPAVAVFSGVLSKVAAYGFLRIVLPMFPYASVHYQTLMLVIALGSILWGTALAFTTQDARLVVAYSSVAQLGFITLGIFSLRVTGEQGALLQMLNHALVSAPLFFIVAALARRCGGSEDMRDMGGVAFRAPVLAALFLIVALATLAMPGSSNFIGEFMILLGVFRAKMAISIIAFVGVAGAAVYALRLFIRTMHNRVGPGVRSFDIRPGELAALAPVVLIILVFAFYPQFGLRRSESSVRATIAPAQAVASAPPAPASAAAGATRSGTFTASSTP